MKELSKSEQDYLLKINKIQSSAVAAYLIGFSHVSTRITSNFTSLVIFTHSKAEIEKAVCLLENYIDENDKVYINDLSANDKEFYTAEISFTL